MNNQNRNQNSNQNKNQNSNRKADYGGQDDLLFFGNCLNPLIQALFAAGHGGRGQQVICYGRLDAAHFYECAAITFPAVIAQLS